MREVYIVSAVRTAFGSFGGALAGIPATKLGAAAIKGALEKASIDAKEVDEVYMGSVLQANMGQAPARQAALFAGLGNNVPCTTINKVCASGMKAVMMAAQSIALGDADTIVAGGMENMSQVPYYLENARYGYKLGNGQLIDGLVKDGLIDVYNNYHMGVAGELCAKTYEISRKEQDDYAVQSYERSSAAWSAGKFDNEIVPVAVPQKKGDAVLFKEDEEYKNVNFSKIPELKPVFQKDGTITAANASTLNDGAAAIVLMSKEKAEKLGIKPLAKIKAFADAAQEPEWFTTAPSKVLPLAIKKANLDIKDIDFFEINEAFAVVSLANNKKLGLDSSKVNVNGGAISLGHPLGCSGARIIATLVNVLKQNNGKYGAAAICNGGGGASALVIENI